MAWRIHDSVQRGEIDNRERGLVRGRIWLCGLADPIVLELKGNACADLAGCLLTFENPGETFAMRADAHFNPVQRGTIGDLTASRKVRVFDLPIEEAYRRKKEGLPVPEHLGNSLYLEWFSEANGRVVIESSDYKLTISPPAWQLTPGEEQQREREAAGGFAGFLNKLSEALEAAKHKPPDDQEWDEFDYEKFMRESDARTDQYMELLDKYQDHPDQERIIAKEMGWLDDEEPDPAAVRGPSAADSSGDEPPASSAGANEDDPLDVDEINRLCAEAAENPPAPNPLTEGIDWVRDEDGDIKHPLSRRAFNSSIALWHKCKELGLDEDDNADLCALLSEFQITGAKLAGALNSLAYDRASMEGSFVVACLKRALDHLHKAQAALEKLAPLNLLPGETVSSTRAELFALRDEILRLMKEFRERR
jgi:hypothetical protein